MRGELFQDHFVKWPDDSHAQLPGAHKNKIRIKEGGAVKHDDVMSLCSVISGFPDQERFINGSFSSVNH